MKIKTLSLIVILVSFTLSLVAYGSVSTSPSSFKVVKTQSSLVNITYSFSQTAPDGVWTSNSGSFKVMGAAGGEIIGTNPSLLSVNIANGSGKVSEVLTIPLGVIQKVLDRGENAFWYEREFNFSVFSEKAILNIFITTQAEASFSINRVELFFENGLTNAVVKRYTKSLKAYVRVNFTGSGILRGHWEVNDGVLYPVAQYISGQVVLFETPDVPFLPTFDVGSHILRFVITNPEVNVEIPALVYFIIPEEEKPIFTVFFLFSPQNQELIRLPFTFTWEATARVDLYLIEFYEK